MIPFLKKYFSKLYVPIAWTLIISVLCFMPGSLVPNESGFKIPQFDKFVHMGMFGGCVFLWNLYLSKRIPELRKLLRLFFLIYILGSAYGIASEFIQKYWIPGRDYDNEDIIADLIGAGLAYGLSHVWLITGAKKGL